MVRIMKANLKDAPSKMVVEVIEQLRNRFAPALNNIKKRIEGLIEREYLIRTEENRYVIFFPAEIYRRDNKGIYFRHINCDFIVISEPSISTWREQEKLM